MSDTRGTLIIEGDASDGLAALQALGAAGARSEAALAGIATELARAEAEAAKLADETERLGGLAGKLPAEVEQTAEAIERAVVARKAEAEQLEHQAKRLRTLGGEQSRIAELQERAIALRLEAAELAGREGEAAKLARQQELTILRSTTAARKQAAREQAEAAKAEQQAIAEIESARKEADRRAAAADRERRRHVKAWAAEEQAAAREIATEQARAARLQEAAAREQEKAWRDATKEAADYTKQLKQAAEAAEKAERNAGRIAQSSEYLKQQGQAVTGFFDRFKGVAEFAGAIGNVVSGIESVVNLLGQAYDLANRISSESIEAKNVAANLQVDISGARDAFKGYVDDVQLAKIANQAFELGVVSTGEELEELARGVQAKAERLGVDSTQLFENAVTAVGRGSALILDNLGIILDQAKAEQIYADSLGVTIKQLTALQREEAFQKAALIEIAKAGKSVQASVDGMAESWQRGVVDWKNFKQSVLGFDDSLGRLREGLRQLDEKQLDRLRFGEVADDASQAGRELNKMLSEWGMSLDDIRLLADKTGVSYQQLIKNAQNDIVVQKAEEARKELEATNRERAKALTEEAGQMDHSAALIEAMGGKQSEILALQEESLMLRLEAAEAIKDEAAALEITRQLELTRAKAEAPRRRGGGRRDPNAALERELELTLAIENARRSVYEAETELIRSAEQRAAREFFLLEMARDELDIRQRAAEARKVRGADQEAEREIELLEIRTERRLLDVQVQLAARADEQRQEAERLEALDQEIERLAAVGVATRLLEQQRAEAHVAFAERFGTEAERRQAEHEAELFRIEDLRAAKVADAEAALLAYNREVELDEARGIERRDAVEQQLLLELAVADAEGNADRRREVLHQREVARIRQRVEAQRRASQAAGDFLTQGMSLFSAVSDAAIKDEAKRERAALRARGVEALARGALEVVEAVAAYASFNYVQGALHTAAAAVAFTQGGMMLAGRIPGQGGAAAASPGAGAGGGGFGQGSSSTGQQQELPEVPASAQALVDIRGGDRVQTTQQQQQQQGGQTIVFQNSTVIAGDSGQLLDDVSNRQQRRAWGMR